jgi:hypothetical protein
MFISNREDSADIQGIAGTAAYLAVAERRLWTPTQRRKEESWHGCGLMRQRPDLEQSAATLTAIEG